MGNIDILKIIKENIVKSGFHVTFVRDGQNPNFSYTVGLKEVFGFELIISGGYVSLKFYEDLFNYVVKHLQSECSPETVVVESDVKYWEKIGLRLVDKSWTEHTVLGVHDYYKNKNILIYQLYPKEYDFIDIPDMTKKWSVNDPIWCWLGLKWNEKIPISSYAITNLGFLKGEVITEVMRWEEGYWEMFTKPGPDVLDNDVRVLPISVFIGIDPTLKAVLNLNIGDGIWRKGKNLKWNNWN